ncbi:Cytochrome P450 72A14 [Zea mays]|uniref:Cytochrome P450 CYP72A28v2 n=1 Tax=Zea mays TaxID=4577 RepID=B6SPG9_MAIZE|nr:Cytochrome P450 72A14 [Zea mays]ACG26752.1 cytochrome P450 CYP72A28v2 [Zea mays]|eukprot:NP_001141098.2 cytochrome P450 10 [Zea mays]
MASSGEAALLGGSVGDARAPPLPWKLLALLCAALAVAWCAVRALEWAWWRPRRLARALRSQGLCGTSYRSLAGDAPLTEELNREARSRPLPLGCHDVAPRAMPLFHQTMKEHGKTSITWFGPVPRVTITKPELVREVLSNKFGHYEKLKLRKLQRMLHNGLGSHEGDKWAKHRRIINPAFHLEKLKRMLPAFAACCTDLVERWEGLVADGQQPCEVDVWPEMQNLTGDVISRAAFGSSYLEGRRIFQLQGEQVQLVVQAMHKLHIPGYLYLPTKTNRRMKRIASEIQELLKGIIAKRENALRTGGGAASDDLLGLLLESNMEHCRGDGGKSKASGITTDDVIGECKLFYFAGMETTSVLLTWTMVVLSMHPEWQDRAREEVLHVFGDRTTPDYDGLSRLRIVTMVLYEVLRLYTPLTALQRQTYKPMELGGVRYPAGVMLMLPLLCIHHDKDVWGPDASEFRPQRFAEGVSRASRDAPAFFPFGWGPRTCIGQSFALLEAKMGLSMILQRFAFELSPAYTHAPFAHGMLQPEHGAQVMLRRLP